MSPPRYSGHKLKQFLRLGCAALATMLAVGSVPFLRGFAAGNGGTVAPQTYNNSMTDGVLTIDQSGTINGWTYEDNDITSVIINADNVTVDTYAFSECNALTSVTVNGNNAQFNNYSIDECHALTSITVNGNNARFGQYAFLFDPNVTSVTISGSNPSFGDYVFSDEVSATITFQCPAIQSDFGFMNLTDQSTVRFSCGFTVNGTTVTTDNASSFFGEANVAIDHSMTKTNAKAATCTEDGNIDYWTCSGCHKIFSDANGTTEITEADTKVAALGHDFHDDDWATVTEATNTAPGEEEHFCHRDGCGERETREIPKFDFQFTADSQYTWTKGSTDGMVVIIKKMSGDDTQTFSKLVSVSVDGTTLTRDTDYTAEPGSIKLTLSPDYLSTLDAGDHTLSVELTVTTLTHTFTVAAPAATDSPASGESLLLISVSLVLMLLAAGGVAYVLIRRKKIAE